ncbi:hypothetical protein ACWGPP_19240, partial [Agromyces sp. NPDC055657]
MAITSKYCVVWCSGASAFSIEGIRLAPLSGICSIPSIEVGIGRLAASRMVGTTSVMWVNWDRRPP